MVVDVVGREGSLDGLIGAVETAGFKRYSQLVRLARPAAAVSEAAPSTHEVTWAGKADAPAIMSLLEGSFDRYADQLPAPYELEAAIEAKQILVIRVEQALAALLFFETQGATSTVRYWAVDERHRANRFGAALIRHYFNTQPAVRRFVLWVTADNKNAVEKYRHYGYTTDGLIDHVLVNDKIRA